MMDKWVTSPIELNIQFGWGQLPPGDVASNMTYGTTVGDVFTPHALLQLRGQEPAHVEPLDGTVTLSNAVPFAHSGHYWVTPYMYSPISALEHEISEILGRQGFGPGGTLQGPLDQLPRNAFELPLNGNAGGDYYDWASGVSGDAFGSAAPGVPQNISQADVNVMSALGYSLGQQPHGIAFHP